MKGKKKNRKLKNIRNHFFSICCNALCLAHGRNFTNLSNAKANLTIPHQKSVASMQQQKVTSPRSVIKFGATTLVFIKNKIMTTSFNK